MSSMLLSFLNQAKNKKTLKILFSIKEDWEQSIVSGIDPAKYEIVFESFKNKQNFSDFDLVIPLSIEDQIYLGKYSGNGPKNFFIPPTKSRCIADDKFEFIQFLNNHSFGKFVPPLSARGQFPYILKKKISAFGVDCYIVNNEEDEKKYAELIDDEKNYFLQTIVEDHSEYTTHIFYYKKIIFHRTFQFTYSDRVFIKGCKSKGDIIQKIPTPFIPIWKGILKSMNYEGIGCFNYKIKGKKPTIFEFNPRFGSSLTSEVSSVIEAQMKCL